MVRLRHEPGCRVAGNGLWRSFQWELLRLKATLFTWSLHCSSLNEPGHTSPKSPWPARAVVSVATPCDPETRKSTIGAPGSLVEIRIVAVSSEAVPVGE